MHEATKKSLAVVARLIEKGDYVAYTVINSEFPDEQRPDQAYFKRILTEYDLILNEIASVLSKQYGAPVCMYPPNDSPLWARDYLRVTGWSIAGGILYTLIETYDDWDFASCITIGYAPQSSVAANVDPWEYGRTDV